MGRFATTNLTKEKDTQITSAELSSPSTVQSGDTVFAVLAQRASERSPAELWTTALGGSVNAVFIWWQHPHLHWLGAGCMAVAAYGLWGLADRAIRTLGTSRETAGGLKLNFLRGLRGIAAPAGVISALIAAGSFMAAALGGWIH